MDYEALKDCHGSKFNIILQLELHHWAVPLGLKMTANYTFFSELNTNFSKEIEPTQSWRDLVKQI